MATQKTIDLLPEIFQTETNRQFLAATLDQLVQEPRLKRSQGFVGRKVGPGVNPLDRYIIEPTTDRADYQLETGVCFLENENNTVLDAVTYPGMLDALSLSGGMTDQQARLFNSEYYAWDSFCDLDKFVNYSQYYWLPGGPNSVDISAEVVPLTNDFDVTDSGLGFDVSGYPVTNPTIVLARGGNYVFNVSQPGEQFWIQSAPGINGRLPQTPNISSRDVYGVVNNGEDNGTVEFYVPYKTSQNFFYDLEKIPPVDLVAGDIKFNEINNVRVSDFLAAYPQGIDGITQLNGRTIVFTNRITGAEAGGWQITSFYDPLVRTAPPDQPDGLNGAIGSYDTTTFDQVTDIDDLDQRYSVWLISYRLDTDGNPWLSLSSVRNIPRLTQFKILYGEQYSNTTWYRESSGFLDRVPLITATQDVLYYQSSTNPLAVGEIRLVEVNNNNFIDIEAIIGAKSYTSPNGVVFTNGLKVQFRGPTVPPQYQNLEYYVEGVGTGPGIENRIGFIDGEAYFGPWHLYQNRKMTGAAHDPTVLQLYIYDTVAESLANPAGGAPEGAPLPTQPLRGYPKGNGIKLIPVAQLITPEIYTKSESNPFDLLPYDVGGYDTSLNQPLVQDYITVNRSSPDRNAWCRSNRWFHIDVIRYSAQVNNSELVLDNAQRAKRPIIEFRGGLKLFQSGTQYKTAVNIVDFNQTDALSNVKGQTGYGVDGYQFIDGTTVIFAADLDPLVRNNVYTVRFIDPTNTNHFVIDLVPTQDSRAKINETVLSLNGMTQQGTTFYFDGAEWKTAQQKQNVNQPPLWDVYDADGRSFSDTVFYPSTNFQGCKLFGYADGGTLALDPVLGLSLKYLNLENIGDIVFDNFFYTDTFIYVKDRISTTLNVSTGFVRQYDDRIAWHNLIGWTTAQAPTQSQQVFAFTYESVPLVCDVILDEEFAFNPIKVFVNGVYLDRNKYTYTINTAKNTTVISLPATTPVGSKIEVFLNSQQVSQTAFYTVPSNLSENPINQNSTSFTLGSIRNHYGSIGQNLRDLQGPINGANNSRDLGAIQKFGSIIVQQSSPLTLAGVFLRRQQYELFQALTYNSTEYAKYKAQLLDFAARGDFINLTPSEILDAVINEIGLGRGNIYPFYWSDMIPWGAVYNKIDYTVSFISTNFFDLSQSYDFTSSNYQGVLVWLNGRLLTRGTDYVVPVDAAVVEFLIPLTIGDQIQIREYASTYGSYVPNTPTKMGMYPAFRPSMFLDETYVDPQMVIQGHDGSITVAFGDFRDDVLLEFETRIYNNLKIDTAPPMLAVDVIPGQFRDTDWTLTEINEILSQDFLNWIGYNRLNYSNQTYQANNPFTYNYNQSSDRLNGDPLLGAWRGIYNYFYDTITPNTTPWQMLGFSEQPTWWRGVYGPAPYTSGNLVLWRDLAAGFIADPNNPRFDARYARPGLLDVIPSGTEGQLLNPLEAVVGNYDATSFRRSWTFGDDGPVENAWRTSSSWPFAVMRLLALTQPAKFFSVMADRDRYQYNESLEQFVWEGRYRLDAKNLGELYGSSVSRASYINWIVDYNQQLGVNSSEDLSSLLSNIDVRLCWRLASFSDKQYLKVYLERSTPGGTNASLLLPDESYQLLLYQNIPSSTLVYSSVVIQRTLDGWSVSGYGQDINYFEILASRPGGKSLTISAGATEVRVPSEYSNRVVRVPYGYVFTNAGALCDFLLSYGQLLQQRGMTFTTVENGYIMNWGQMAQEFLYWSNQGWAPGSIINLNPTSTTLIVDRPGFVATSLTPSRSNSFILDQNFRNIPVSDLVITRLDNSITLRSLTSATINFVKFEFTQFENIIVLDNRSLFADLIYDPVTGNRQNRIYVSGWISADWNGLINAPGFVINQDSITEWQPNRKYTKGDIVIFKDKYWSAANIIQPSQNFDYSQWLLSDYQDIQKGLLPNAATASDQLKTAYSIYNANLEEEADLFSYGLIGFRPRRYMESLNLDDVSQVNLYQQFLGSKGTRPALEIFSLANLGKETAEYNIYEKWAVLRGVYGANANKRYVEIRLNEDLLPSDPSIIQIVEPQETSEADQTVLVSDLWNTSYKVNNVDILPTTLDSNPDVDLPTAGYVSLDDVDITLFSLDDAAALDQFLDTIGIGSTIWVAKSNAYDWNVYRTEKTPGRFKTLIDNLDGTSRGTFDANHDLVVGQNIIIKYFNPAVDGVYRVLAVPNPSEIVIAYSFEGFATSASGTGIVLKLVSYRVAQASDIVDLAYDNLLTKNIKVWVDDFVAGRWAVLEKQNVLQQTPDILPLEPDRFGSFGSSVSQGLFNNAALVGAPNYNPTDVGTATGAVYGFVKTEQDQYAYNSLLLLDATGTAGYGNSIDIGSELWAVAGASKSLGNVGYAAAIFKDPAGSTFEQKQILLPPDQDFGPGEFGYSVTVSQNERWMYIGAPGTNKVYAYNQVYVQPQSVTYITDGIVSSFNYSNSIVINYQEPLQLLVVLNNKLLRYQTDYTIDQTDVVLYQTPTDKQVLTISRKASQTLDQRVQYNVPATGGTGTAATFDVNNTRGVYAATGANGGYDYTVNDVLYIDQNELETYDSPFAAPISTAYSSGYPSATITVASTTGITPGMVVQGIGMQAAQTVVSVGGPNTVTLSAAPNSPPSGTLVFSNAMALLVTAVDENGAVTNFTIAGQGIQDTVVYELDRYFFTVENIFSFSVYVNDVIQRPYLDYDYNSDSSTGQYDLVFNTIPAPGDTILVKASTYFNYVDLITVPGLAADARFGHSVSCTTDGRNLIVGAPNVSNTQGRSYVFARSYQSFVVSNTSNNEFRPTQSLSVPGSVAVSVNSQYLLPETNNIGGGYVVDVSNPGDEFVTVTAPLAVGDIVDIETNQWQLTETLTSQNPLDKAKFGWQVDQCVNNCSLYVGAPYDSSVIEGGGLVEFYQNQARVYGTIASTIANPPLTPGDYIVINGFWIQGTGSTVEQLVQDINTAAPVNAVAQLTPDLELLGDGVTKTFDVGNIYRDATSGGATRVLIDGHLMNPGVDYVYNNNNRTITFSQAPVREQQILVVSGRIVISCKNFDASVPLSRLSVMPGPGSLFGQVGFDVYAHQQTIQNPLPIFQANFGESLFISEDTTTLMVGAPNSNTILPTTFDSDTTVFDSSSTRFFDTVIQSGAVYVFNALPSANPSISNPLQFVFGQQLTPQGLSSLDRFGAALDYTTGHLLVGAPGSDLGDSSAANFGKVVEFVNANNQPAWQVVRVEQPQVDLSRMNQTYLFDITTQLALEYLDYFNPLQGKLLGVVQENLDYIGAVDPAAYNVGTINNFGQRWDQGRLGEIWWDTSLARFIDPGQDNLTYASRRWGQLFPGSVIEVFQWIVSTVPPAEYTGPGVPRSTTSYVEITSLNDQGFIETLYYFWASGLTAVASTKNKTLSIDAIARYIDNPRASGIAYLAPLSSSAVALYNCGEYINNTDTALHIDFDQERNDDPVHAEYQLISQDLPESFLTDTLYEKMLDSLCGVDITGRPVPDPFLPINQKYGVNIRPRQSMVVNRFAALQNYLVSANRILLPLPVSDGETYSLLESVDPQPTEASGQWDFKVADIEELSYQELRAVPLGYKYLVNSDVTNNGLWTIYEVVGGILPGSRVLRLLIVQNYDTRKYWTHVDWYAPGYSALTQINFNVDRYDQLASAAYPVGTIIKVDNNARNKWELYLSTTTGYQRIGLQDGTIQISNLLWDYQLGRFGFGSEVFDAQYFDEAPLTETRKVLQALNQQIFVGSRSIFRNQLLTLFFNYVLSEQLSPTWLTKTSLIDVDHVIRDLLQFQTYKADNQDFVLNYIKEVKPYHVQIDNFNLKYRGLDTYLGSLTDFDLPAYYDSNQRLFISPVLDNTGLLSTTSSVPSTSPLWQTFPYNQWFNNYLLSVESVSVGNPGSGYISPPKVIVTGECQRPAEMAARINSAGQVVEVYILDPGEGYLSTALISFDSSSGSGADAVATMTNNKVRNLTTNIKFDRYQYYSDVEAWQPNTIYVEGDRVRYADRVWQARAEGSEVVVNSEFDTDQWQFVPANDLSGVDRTMGYYTPTANQPGLELSLLISGVQYPGVQVAALDFSFNTGFDIGGFDDVPYDNIDYSPEGYPTYDQALLDADYASNFLDPYLGTRPSDINVDGGAFVDTYESYAPEELVPGITYDTLDFRVFTTPGDDYDNQGRGFPRVTRSATFTSLQNANGWSYRGLLDNVITVELYNTTTGVQLLENINYTVDYVAEKIFVLNSVLDGQTVTIVVNGMGGGNQVSKKSVTGLEVTDEVEIDYPYNLIQDIAIFVNGQQTLDFDYAPLEPGRTLVIFDTALAANQRAAITAFSPPIANPWSTPVTQTIVADGGLSYTLVNPLPGTNPVNIIVSVNGIRARPSEGIDHIADGSTTKFSLPNRGGYNLGLVANNDVSVWVNNVAQILGVNFELDPYIGSGDIRTINFFTSPAVDSRVLISVRTNAQYWVTGNQLVFQPSKGLSPSLGDIITATTFNNYTAAQNILTQVFVGPETEGLLLSEPFDSVPYDQGSITDDPGSYDYSEGVIIYSNTFDTGRIITNAERIIVTLDGRYLFENNGFTVDGSVVNITGPAINASQVVAITSFTMRTAPNAMAFRIFKDMRGLQSTYRITNSTTTQLTQPLSSTADVIHVQDASKMPQPDLAQALFGIVTINGERITYRERDLVQNTLRGLRRGTAGTGASSHAVGSNIYDITLVNYLRQEYQDRIISENFLGNGTQEIFTTSISLEGIPTPFAEDSVLVYVGGERLLSGYQILGVNTVQVRIIEPPASGYQVTIAVRQAQSWYTPGVNTPSNGVPLQETDNQAARFLRGLN